MSDKMKYVKLMNQNGTVASTVPIGVDAVNVDFSDGKTLVQKLGLYTTKQELATSQQTASNTYVTKTQINTLKQSYATKADLQNTYNGLDNVFISNDQLDDFNNTISNTYTTKTESNIFKNAIVEVFDPNKAYDKGTCVLNDVNDGGDGKVYKLTTAHASGVAWKNTQKVATVISKQLRGGITIDITNHALVIE